MLESKRWSHTDQSKRNMSQAQKAAHRARRQRLAPEGYVNQTEAAQTFGVKRGIISQGIDNGDIASVRFGRNDHFIAVKFDDVREYLKEWGYIGANGHASIEDAVEAVNALVQRPHTIEEKKPVPELRALRRTIRRRVRKALHALLTG